MSGESVFEFAITCGMHASCDPMKAQPEFGVFPTYEVAAKRAATLQGRVMQRRIDDWIPVSKQLDPTT